MKKPFQSNQVMNRNYYGKKAYRYIFFGVLISTAHFIFSTLALSTSNAYSQAEIETVEAVGTAIVHKMDVETAKQQAISNGLVSILDKVLTEMLSKELIAENFSKINNTIYDETDKFINDYKVLTEAVSKKNYRVLIQAKVSMKRLNSHLVKSGMMRVKKKKIQNIEIVVQGTRNLSHFFNFRKGLKEILGVKTVQVSDIQDDEANLLVNFEGSLKEFTDALVLKKFDQFSIRIFEISATQLRIELISG